MTVKDTMASIAAIESKIKEVDKNLIELKTQRNHLYGVARIQLESNETTGDRIRDLVIRTSLSGNAELEERYRKLESRLKGHAGELVLFSFARRMCTRHVFMPSPGHENTYEDHWYTAVGILKEDLLRIEDVYIVFAIDTYVVSPGDTPRQLKFEKMEHLRAGPYPVSLELDTYADAGMVRNRGRQLCIGDNIVRAWFDSGGSEGKRLFKTCCYLLSKLFLEPTV